MESILKFFTSYWETIIAVSGFIISIINLIYLIKNNLKSIDIKELYFLKMVITNKYHYEFTTIFVNKSKLPISIINIEIINNNKSYYSKSDKTIVCEHKDSQGVITKIMTADFPINLNCLESKKEIIYFKLDEELEKENFKMIIYTNRGKLEKNVSFKQKQVKIQEYAKNLF